MLSYIFFGASALTLGFVAYNIFPIAFYLYDFITLGPGVGRIYSRHHPKGRKKKVFVDTNYGTLRLPYVKLPSPDSEVYIFEDESTVGVSHVVAGRFFRENYHDKKFVPLTTYELGLITDIMKPSDFRNKKRICGFISSLFLDNVYLFAIDDKLIDYEKLFDDYDEAMLKFENVMVDVKKDE